MAIQIVIELDDNASSGVDKLSGKLKDVDGQQMGTVSAGLSNIGAIAGGAALAGVVALGSAFAAFTSKAITDGMAFEAQLDAIAAISGASAEEMVKLEEAAVALSMNPNYIVNLEEAGQAMEALAASGATTTEILGGAAEASILLANATGSEFGAAAATATDVMSLFGIEAGDMMEAVNGIVSVTDASKFSFNDYRLALAQAGGIASTIGVEFDDLNASIASIAPAMSGGSDAGTSLRSMLVNLSAPSEKAIEKLNELGISAYDASGQLLPMSNIAEQLNQALYGTSTVLTEVGGLTSEQRALLETATDSYESAQESIQKYQLGLVGVGLSEEARAKKIADLNGQMVNAQNIMDELGSVRGDLVESTKQLTEEERANALAVIFGVDGQKAASELAKSGATIYTDLATAMSETGFSQEQLTAAMEDGKITQFELTQAQMGLVDAQAAAEVRNDNLKGSWEALKGVVDGLAWSFYKQLEPGLSMVVKWGTQLLEVYGPQMITAFNDISAGVASFFESLGLGDSAGITSFIDSISSMLTVDNVLGAFDSLMDNLTPLLLDGMTAAFNALKTFYETADWVGMANTAVDWLVSGFNLWYGLELRLGEFWASILNWFYSQDWAGLFTAWYDAVATVNQVYWERFSAALAGVWANITTWFYSQDYAGLFAGFLTSSSEAGAGMWEQFSASISGLWESLSVELSTLYTNITTWFAAQDWGLIMTNALTSLLQGLYLGVQAIIDGVAWYYTTFNAAMVAVDWPALGFSLMTLLIDGFMMIGTILPNTALFLMEAFVTGAYMIGTALDALFMWIGETASTIIEETDWAGMGNAALEDVIAGAYLVLGSLEAFFTWLGETVSTFILNTDWATMGKSIMDGIVAGVLASAQNVINAITGVLSGAWAAAKAEMGIESPSKVMAQTIGAPMGQGVAVGIQSQAAAVTSAMDSLLGGAMATGQGLTVNNSRNISLNVNVNTNSYDLGANMFGSVALYGGV